MHDALLSPVSSSKNGRRSIVYWRMLLSPPNPPPPPPSPAPCLALLDVRDDLSDLSAQFFVMLSEPLFIILFLRTSREVVLNFFRDGRAGGFCCAAEHVTLVCWSNLIPYIVRTDAVVYRRRWVGMLPWLHPVVFHIVPLLSSHYLCVCFTKLSFILGSCWHGSHTVTCTHHTASVLLGIASACCVHPLPPDLLPSIALCCVPERMRYEL